MSNRTPAPTICRRWRAGDCRLLIPGGWQMQVPEYSVDLAFHKMYLDYYIRRGFSHARALKGVQKVIQKPAQYGFVHSLLGSIHYFATVYAKLHPERLIPVAGKKDTFELAGYDPETAQRLHIPGEHPGQRPTPIRQVLAEMGA